MVSQTASTSNPSAPELTRDDVGFFSSALTAARAQFSEVGKILCAEFSLGPRGPWIISLIGKAPLSPLALSSYFSVGRSLITAELNRLAEAGLINQDKSEQDGRRVHLSLTAEGEKLFRRLGDSMHALLRERLHGYSRDQIMLCAQMLADFADFG